MERAAIITTLTRLTLPPHYYLTLVTDGASSYHNYTDPFDPTPSLLPYPSP